MTPGTSRDRAPHRLVLADDQRDRLAAKAHDALGERRLVGEGRDDAEAVDARDVLGGEHRDDAGMRAPERARSPNANAACACGERTARATSASAGHSSAPNISAPESFRAPSRRGRRRPTEFSCGRSAATGAPKPMRVAHRVDDRAIAGAAAQHAAERVLRSSASLGRGVPPQQRDGGEQHRRACRRRIARRRGHGKRREAARRSARCRSRPSIVSTARPSTCPTAGQAGADRLAVEQHRAGAAVAGVAADLDARQPAAFAQGMAEPLERRSVDPRSARR